jgi:hypothetical protein
MRMAGAERGKPIPAIGLTGYGAASDIEKRKAAGFLPPRRG